MGVYVIGLSHHTAPVEVRELVAIPEAELDAAVAKLAGMVDGEALLVSTCNRVEAYLSTRDGQAPAGDLGAARAHVVRFLSDVVGADPQVIDPVLYGHGGAEAVKHLFRVASSLDSMVVGEPQILGQVKSAYESARRVGTLGATLERTLQRAFAVAKRVRTETEISRSSASVASAGVELAREIFGELDGKEMLVVGAGKMAALAARHLVSAGTKKIRVVNRTLARAEALAAEIGGEARPWTDLEALLGRVDIVLCSTGAPRPVVGRELVQRAMKARRGRWLCFIDIAVPRDVEPEVGQLENVYLYDVDELTALVDGNLADRQREAERAERIVAEELKRFSGDEKTLGVVPTIKALRERCLGVARTEAERVLGSKLRTLGEAERREVRAMAEAIVNKLLHAPLTALKRDADSEALVRAATALFALDEAAPATQVTAAAAQTTSAATSSSAQSGAIASAASGGSDAGGRAN